jgi:hypothetical protein
LLSADERQVGVTKLDESGRIPFPTLLRWMDGPGAGRGFHSILGQAIARRHFGSGRKTIPALRSADGKTTTQKLGENFKSNPTTFAIHDVDQDGLPDLVILIPYEKIKILREVAGQPFEEYDVARRVAASSNRG